jgi:hypothetical protein
MSEHISCCGRNCHDCKHFPHDCVGCNEVAGRVFWLQYVDEVICPIFNCCQNVKHYIDCGLCGEHPCWRYEEDKIAPDDLPMLETIEPKWIDVKVS